MAFSILTLMILTNFYNQNPKATTKIIIQILSLLIIADIVWIILYSSAWEHSSENSAQKKNLKEDNEFWDSLSFIHSTVYFLAYVELILKCCLLYYLIADFKEKYKLGDLLNFNYTDGKNSIQPQNVGDQQMNFDNSMNNYVNESNNSYNENFQNKYD